MKELNKKKFMKEIIGRKITKVNLKDKDCDGDPLADWDIRVESIELDSGKAICFSGSSQIDETDVWVWELKKVKQ